MHTALCIDDGNVLLSDYYTAQDLISCGVLFAPTVTMSLEITNAFKPLVVNLWHDFLMCKALQRYGDTQLTVDHDHIAQSLQAQSCKLSLLREAVKGNLSELYFAWEVAKRVRKAGGEESASKVMKVPKTQTELPLLNGNSQSNKNLPLRAGRII